MKKYFFMLLLILPVFFFNTSNVFAEVSYDLEFRFMNRTYSQFPFTTDFSSGENANYPTNQVNIYGTSQNIGPNPPMYLNVIYCSLLPLNFNTNSMSKGNMANLGYLQGPSCKVQGHESYDAKLYLQTWNIYQWADLSSSAVYEYGLSWNMTVNNSSSYGTYITMQTLFLSNERIASWHDYGLIDSLLNNQNIIKSKLDQIQSALGSNNSILGNINTNTNITKQNTEDIKEKANDIDDTLNDSSVDSSDDTLNDLSDNLPTNSVISDLILLPVSMLRGIVNAIDGSCSNFSLGSLYGTNLVMPCINIQNYVGSAIWTFIDLVFSGIFVLVIRKKFIQIFENITNLKGGGNEVD